MSDRKGKANIYRSLWAVLQPNVYLKHPSSRRDFGWIGATWKVKTITIIVLFLSIFLAKYCPTPRLYFFSLLWSIALYGCESSSGSPPLEITFPNSSFKLCTFCLCKSAPFPFSCAFWAIVAYMFAWGECNDRVISPSPKWQIVHGVLGSYFKVESKDYTDTDPDVHNMLNR